jgi:hypothetical protein
MSSRPQRADLALRDAPAAAALIARLAAARDAARLIAPLCAQILPGFDATRPGVCDVRADTLHLLLPSGAHCAKIRQAAPRITAVLRHGGFEVNEITATVQAHRIPASGQAQRMKEAGPDGGSGAISSRTTERSGRDLSKAMGFAEKLAHTIPDSELRQAALRLQAACAGRLAHMRESGEALGEQDERETNTRGERT